MPKRKPPLRYLDIHQGSLAGDVEMRAYVVRSRSSRMGRSSINIECPFCHHVIETFLWSLAGGGKRCQCGALFGSSGQAYSWKETADA